MKIINLSISKTHKRSLGKRVRLLSYLQKTNPPSSQLLLLPEYKLSILVKNLISVDPNKLPWDQETPLHNRWHPDIPPVASVKEGQIFRVECVDWTGG